MSWQWGANVRGLVAWLACVGLLACGGHSPGGGLPESPSAEIPIRRVVLYQNGVGYFERQGKLDGDVLTLRIRPSQINDLLKSLAVIDAGDGRAVSISLPLEKTGDRVLMELPEQVRHAGGLLDVLRVFRGARVSVTGSAGSRSGRVVGVENLPRQQGENLVPDWRLTLRTESGELLVYPVRSISQISIEDRALAVGLDQSLDVSLNEGNWKPITLSIRLAGKKEHQLRASYIVEMPRWKPAYRLVLGGSSPLLQAWAVVDNVSGEDWNDIQLSLVAGTPMSFLYDLHSPQFTERSDLTPRGRTQAIAPPKIASGVEAVSEVEDTAAEGFAAGASAPMKKRSKSGSAAPQAELRRETPTMKGDFDLTDEELAERLEEQAGPDVQTQEMGALFRYDIPNPVTVPDRSSTLVAIANQRVDAEEVVYFSPESIESGSPPFRAVKFTNNTALTLEKGPVALYSEGTFSGEGFLDRVEPGSTHFIGYAVDSRVSLSTDYSTQEDGARLVKISGGRLVSEVLRIERTTYRFTNLHTEPVLAYVRAAKRSDWELQDRPPKTVEAPGALLVPVPIPASGKAELTLPWARRLTRYIAIDDSTSRTVLRVYLKGNSVAPNVRQALDKVLAIQDQLADVRQEMRHRRQQHDTHSADQRRVRANLNTLRKTKGNQRLIAELSRKLADLENKLGQLSGQLVALSEREADLKAQLKVLISTISLQPPPTSKTNKTKTNNQTKSQ